MLGANGLFQPLPCMFAQANFKMILGPGLFAEAGDIIARGALAELELLPDGKSATALLQGPHGQIKVTAEMIAPRLLAGKCRCLRARRGELCPHIGAVALAAQQARQAEGVSTTGVSRGGSTPPSSRSSGAVSPGPGVVDRSPAQRQILQANALSRAYELRLPPDLERLWGKGHLSIMLKVCQQPVSQADLHLAEWLKQHGYDAKKPPAVLGLSHAERAGFFPLIVEHPRLHVASAELPCRLERANPPLEFELSADLQRCKLSLGGAEAGSYWLGLGEEYLLCWHKQQPALSLYAMPACPEGLSRQHFAELTGSGSCELATSRILGALQQLSESFVIDEPQLMQRLALHSPPAKAGLQLDYNSNRIALRGYIDYGEFARLPLHVDLLSAEQIMFAPGQGFWRRDHAYECELLACLQSSGFSWQQGYFLLESSEACEDFLQHRLAGLKQHYELLYTKNFRVWQDSVCFVELEMYLQPAGARTARPAAESGAQSSSDFVSNPLLQQMDWLEPSFGFSHEGQQYYISQHELVQILARGSKRINIGGNRQALFDAELIGSALGWYTAEANQRVHNWRLFAMQAHINNNTLPLQLGEQQQQLRQVLQQVCAQLPLQLHAYQLQGVEWLLGRMLCVGAALLADDMGLGKTLQTLVLVECLRKLGVIGAQQSILICVPTSLLSNWQHEIKRLFPHWQLTLWHGAKRSSLQQSQVVLSTHSLLARDLAWHRKHEYAMCIVDEASALRNAASDASKALFSLQTPLRLALSGTPIENRLEDIWSLFAFLLPAYLGDYKHFRQTYLKQDSAILRLRAQLAGFMLRRKKSEVLSQLPEKLVSVQWCQLSAPDAALYQAISKSALGKIADARKQGKSQARMAMLSALLRLRQLCNDRQLLPEELRALLPEAASPQQQAEGQGSDKISMLLELLGRLRENNEKVLVFSQFASMLGLIAARLERDGVAYLLMDGSTAAKQRSEILQRFKSDSRPLVLLLSLKVGGYGLNLQEASSVIHVDPWWNPAVEMQATDRAHRLGQKKTVNVYKLIVENSLEEKILALQARKYDLLQRTIDDEYTPSFEGLSEQDMEQLLGL